MVLKRACASAASQTTQPSRIARFEARGRSRAGAVRIRDARYRPSNPFHELSVSFARFDESHGTELVRTPWSFIRAQDARRVHACTRTRACVCVYDKWRHQSRFISALVPCPMASTHGTPSALPKSACCTCDRVRSFLRAAAVPWHRLQMVSVCVSTFRL